MKQQVLLLLILLLRKVVRCRSLCFRMAKDFWSPFTANIQYCTASALIASRPFIVGPLIFQTAPSIHPPLIDQEVCQSSICQYSLLFFCCTGAASRKQKPIQPRHRRSAPATRNHGGKTKACNFNKLTLILAGKHARQELRLSGNRALESGHTLNPRILSSNQDYRLLLGRKDTCANRCAN